MENLELSPPSSTLSQDDLVASSPTLENTTLSQSESSGDECGSFNYTTQSVVRNVQNFGRSVRLRGFYATLRLYMKLGRVTAFTGYVVLLLIFLGYFMFGSLAPFTSIRVTLICLARSFSLLFLSIKYLFTSFLAVHFGYILSGHALGAVNLQFHIAIWLIAVAIFPPGAILAMIFSNLWGRPTNFFGDLNVNFQNLQRNPLNSYCLKLFFTSRACIHIYCAFLFLVGAHILNLMPLTIALGWN